METNKSAQILVVDDDLGTRETLSDILAMKNFRVAKAHDGESCLEIIQKQHVDVAILDIRLPDMDGLKLLECMKKSIPDLIAVFMTGHATVDYAQKALEQGACGFFVKPMIIDEILRVINEALEKRSLVRRYKETSAKLNNIISASNDAIFSTDSNGRIMQYNKTAEHIFGYSGEELVQLNIGSLLGRESEAEKSGVLKCHYSFDEPVEVYGRHKKGDLLALEISSGPYEENGKKMFSLIIRDVSARKKHEEEKGKLESQLRQSHKMKAVGTMAGGIAHDFNNILAIILGNAEMAKDDIPPGNPAYHSIVEILEASHRAKNLIRQILAFSRKERVKLVPLELQLAIKETLQLLRSTIPTTVSIIQYICDDRIMIMADPIQIHQLLINLCSNAVLALDEKGEITVRLQEVDLTSEDVDRYRLSPGPYAMLSVTDTGCGMDKDTMGHIFDPFYTTRETGKGTGMGLSVVHGIAKSHGGFITVDSEFGKGSVFKVFLPSTKETAVQQVEATGPLPTGTESILFLDDERSLLEIAHRVLTGLGYKVTAEISSVEALEIFKSDPDEFDLVITDQSMPHMSGTELIAEILKIRPDTSIILCTGFSTKVSEENAKELGISEFVDKPYDKKNLAKTVRKVLDERQK